MSFPSYIFPASRAEFARLRLDDCNISEPCPIYSGPHSGKFFLDADLARRDERWIPLFRPLIADPANEVELVELDEADIQPKEATQR